MLVMNWLESHVGSLDQAVSTANQLYWNMRVEQRKNRWFVQGGDQTLLVTDNQEVLDSFLYGLGLAYSILPEAAFEIINAEVKKMLGEELVNELEQDEEYLKWSLLNQAL